MWYKNKKICIYMLLFSILYITLIISVFSITNNVGELIPTSLTNDPGTQGRGWVSTNNTVQITWNN